ncbi:uncharacterized protein EDB91DRAFT_1137816 [Suillus paluster]|uniref:uncharacterized protein n=1 Tax=Suillus paluster TaxID=48578 RepID=UPI001B86D22E|nr:uncharacterized protein EDB91DRAFT_1137816 [Suillus paluster]KAG1738621.1 hypothetical protein EDB91DRAFT_1137816 [Suillus paluster]
MSSPNSPPDPSLLTTYEYIIKDQSILSKLKWVHTIIGEQNTQSKLAQTLTQYYHFRTTSLNSGPSSTLSARRSSTPSNYSTNGSTRCWRTRLQPFV